MSTDNQTDFAPTSDLHPYMRAPRAQAAAERAEQVPSLEALHDLERPSERFDVKSFTSKPFQAVPVKRDYLVDGRVLIRQGDMLVKTKSTASDGKPMWCHVYQESFFENNAEATESEEGLLFKLFPHLTLNDVKRIIGQGSRAVLIAPDHNVVFFSQDEDAIVVKRSDNVTVIRLDEYRKLLDSLKHERERAEVNKKTVELQRQQITELMATLDSMQSAVNIHREIAHCATRQRDELTNAISAAAGIIKAAL